MIAEEVVIVRTEDVRRPWAVVVQRMQGMNVIERGVTDGMSLLEAVDYAGDVRDALIEEGWRSVLDGRLCKDNLVMVVFVDGSNGEGI